jgi:hypothetical protein
MVTAQGSASSGLCEPREDLRVSSVPTLVFDVFLAIIFVRALVISAWRRFPTGLVASGAGTLLWLGMAAAGWYGRGADGLGIAGAWLLVFLGPSAVPAPKANAPCSTVMAMHPVGTKLVVAMAFAVPFAVAWCRARRLSPLSDEASALKKLGLVYLAPALLLLAQVACWEIAVVAPDLV